ncbi:hypothetical protein [Tenacibaculum sp. 190524A02b]|uniref:Lipocalin-like domain-containing protein n=1 Tax=Tenacibaculum vairaonense TaxID=3137860 RepID=A0ABP1F7K8_9FLAO
MKKTIFKGLVILLSVFTLASCSKSDEPVNNSDLIGEWNLTEFTYSGKTTSKISGQTITTDFEGVGKNFSSKLTFSQNPNKVSASGSHDIDLTYKLFGLEQTNTYTLKDISSEATWTENGDKITFNGQVIKTSTPNTINLPQSNDSYEFTVERLDENSIKLTNIINQKNTVNGATVKVELNTKIVLRR